MALETLVPLGKTGMGKSSLLSTIVGKRNLFKPCPGPNSSKVFREPEVTKIGGKWWRLVDTPGFFDTDSAATNQSIINGLVEHIKTGVSCFLITISASQRATSECIETLRLIHENIPKIEKHSIVVFTGFDNLKADEIEPEDYLEQCRENEKYWMYLGKYEHHFFVDNRDIMSNDIEGLMKKAEEIIDKNGKYDASEFQGPVQDLNDEICGNYLGIYDKRCTGNAKVNIEDLKKVVKDVVLPKLLQYSMLYFVELIKSRDAGCAAEAVRDKMIQELHSVLTSYLSSEN